VSKGYDQNALDAASREVHMMLLREGSNWGTKACEEMGRVFMTAYRKALPSATAAITEPLGVFSDGKWTFDETGQQFTSQQLDNAAFFVYRPHLAAAPTAPVVEAGATGWIAAHESGRIHHFSIADGWTVEVVTK